jgi:hypothetical protein
MSTCFYILILQYTFYYLFRYRLGFLEVLIELFFSTLRRHSCVNISSRASGQKDFTKASAWLTHAVGASVTKLATFYGAPRSHSSKVCSLVSPSSGGFTISTSSWAALLRSSSSFCRRSFSSPSVLIYRRQSANCSSVSVTTFCSLSTSSIW